MTRPRAAAWLGAALVVVAAGCGSGGGPGRSAAPAAGTTAAGACIRNEQDTACLPVAADAARVDRGRPSFRDPTRITNPRFPVGGLTQVLQLGHEGGKPLRVEVTRLPEGRTFTWDGRRTETVASQFVAYLDGRIQEVAVDYFAQADDGSVWYFGEDVANYEDGVVADHDGSWLTGRDGPPGMIMPADPRVGDVYRSENIPGLVFEQDTVRSTTASVHGPRGPVPGTALIQELLMDGTIEEKAFAPGYGEFQARAADELVTVALALPIDGTVGSPPRELAMLAGGARAVFDDAAAGRWPAAGSRTDTMATAWKRIAGDAPELLAGQMTTAMEALARTVSAHGTASTLEAALSAEQAALDLRLRHRPPAEVDLDRLDLWARKLLANATARDRGAVAGDAAVLRTVWDRVGHSAGPAAAARVSARIEDLHGAPPRDLAAARSAVAALRDALRRVEP
jgi:hypothetical protein